MIESPSEASLIAVCNRVALWTGSEVNIEAIATYISQNKVSFHEAEHLAHQCSSLAAWYQTMGERGLIAESEATIPVHVPTLRPPDFYSSLDTERDPFPAHDQVNRPAHYARASEHPSGVECIEIVETLPFCLGNAVKYIYRAGHKLNAAEDYRKAAWYFRRQIETQVQVFFAKIHHGLAKWAGHDPMACRVADLIVDAQAYNWIDVTASLRLAASECEARANRLDGGA
jgi:Protein of unknwon function (DUF3310)